MKSFFRANCVFIFAIFFAQNIDSQDYKPLENALLWQIDHPSLSYHNYLYGTIHLISSDSFFIDEVTNKALHDVDQMVMELDMDDEMGILSLLKVMPKLLMDGNMTLKKLLPDSSYQVVKASLKENSIPPYFEKMQPIFLSMILETSMPSNSEGAAHETTSYEMEFMDIAHAADMPIGGLETMGEQISVFDSIPYDVQAKMLYESILETSDSQLDLNALAGQYRSKNIEVMAMSISDESDPYNLAGFEDYLLINRNKNWIPRMTAWMKEGATFFAVGAAHLATEHGVIHLLRQAGYTLTPLDTIPTID